MDTAFQLKGGEKRFWYLLAYCNSVNVQSVAIGVDAIHAASEDGSFRRC